MSARSATSCGAQARAPRTRFASLSAEAIFRLAIATTFTPARAKLDASPVPTRPAPMKPSVNFFGGICYELYESAGAVARGDNCKSFGTSGQRRRQARVYRVHVRRNGHQLLVRFQMKKLIAVL